MSARERTLDASEHEAAMRAGLVFLAIALSVSLASLGCSRPGPGTASNSEELLTQLHEDRSQIDQTSETMMKRIEMFNASRKPGERGLQFSEIFTQDLSPEQRDILDTLVAQEKDVSYKALLEKIIADRDNIRALQEKVMHLEQALPDKFVVAKKGDTHQKLAMNFLTGEAGLDEAKAKEHLKAVDQTDELVVGNQVWFFYDPGKDTFRTYVTMGDAGQTPVQVRRERTQKLVKERDTYKKERDTAHEQVASLEQDKSHLEQEIVTRQNSLYYHADSTKNLKELGVLSSVLKNFRDVKSISFDQSVNLLQETSITLDPRAYGLEQVRSVKVLPEIYEEGRDYSVEIPKDRSSARIVIHDPEVFKGKEVLLALQG